MQQDPRFGDRKAVAARYGFTDRQVKRWTFEKKIPYYKIGGSVFYDYAETDRWIEEQKVTPR